MISRVLWLLLLLWLLQLLGIVDQAQARELPTAPATRAAGAAAQRVIANTQTGVSIVDKHLMPLGEVTAEMTGTRALGTRGIAVAVARGVASATAAGLAITAAMELARCWGQTQVILCDLGADPSPQPVVVWRQINRGENPAREFPTPGAAAMHGLRLQTGGEVVCVHTPVIQGPTAQQHSFTVWANTTYPRPACNTNPGNGNGSYNVDVRSRSTQELQCPLVNGVSPPIGPDGKCPTGVGTQQSEEQAAERIAPRIANPKAVVDELLDDGIDLSPHADPQSASGPASVSEPVRTSTETDPQGNPRTTTTQVTHQVTYEGNTYNYTTITITNYPDGSTKRDEKPAETDPCKKNPDQLQCKPLDTPGAKDLPSSQKQVTFSPVDLGPSDGACPAPVSIATAAGQLEFGFGPLCQYADGLRPVVIAVCAFVAAMVFVGGVRSGD